jgi:hypothetical protein
MRRSRAAVDPNRPQRSRGRSYFPMQKRVNRGGAL